MKRNIFAYSTYTLILVLGVNHALSTVLPYGNPLSVAGENYNASINHLETQKNLSGLLASEQIEQISRIVQKAFSTVENKYKIGEDHTKAARKKRIARSVPSSNIAPMKYTKDIDDLVMGIKQRAPRDEIQQDEYNRAMYRILEEMEREIKMKGESIQNMHKTVLNEKNQRRSPPRAENLKWDELIKNELGTGSFDYLSSMLSIENRDNPIPQAIAHSWQQLCTHKDLNTLSSELNLFNRLSVHSTNAKIDKILRVIQMMSKKIKLRAVNNKSMQDIASEYTKFKDQLSSRVHDFESKMSAQLHSACYDVVKEHIIGSREIIEDFDRTLTNQYNTALVNFRNIINSELQILLNAQQSYAIKGEINRLLDTVVLYYQLHENMLKSDSDRVKYLKYMFEREMGISGSGRSPYHRLEENSIPLLINLVNTLSSSFTSVIKEEADSVSQINAHAIKPGNSANQPELQHPVRVLPPARELPSPAPITTTTAKPTTTTPQPTLSPVDKMINDIRGEFWRILHTTGEDRNSTQQILAKAAEDFGKDWKPESPENHHGREVTCLEDALGLHKNATAQEIYDGLLAWESQESKKTSNSSKVKEDLIEEIARINKSLAAVKDSVDQANKILADETKEFNALAATQSTLIADKNGIVKKLDTLVAEHNTTMANLEVLTQKVADQEVCLTTTLADKMDILEKLREIKEKKQKSEDALKRIENAKRVVAGTTELLDFLQKYKYSECADATASKCSSSKEESLRLLLNKAGLPMEMDVSKLISKLREISEKRQINIDTVQSALNTLDGEKALNLEQSNNLAERVSRMGTLMANSQNIKKDLSEQLESLISAIHEEKEEQSEDISNFSKILDRIENRIKQMHRDAFGVEEKQDASLETNPTTRITDLKKKYNETINKIDDLQNSYTKIMSNLDSCRNPDPEP
ncbi:hypothetical protein NEAUS06_0129 [Nematocida ausubeli]|nr:hypothetical protein NEAUS06_0129 [Nematocida ausubeli]